MYFSIIIPVYNRPDEIEELLQSLVSLNYNQTFEVVIVEDGSTEDCKSIVEQLTNKLSISYYYKNNSGPGDSRNYGMQCLSWGAGRVSAPAAWRLCHDRTSPFQLHRRRQSRLAGCPSPLLVRRIPRSGA